ncbi:MAG TPA: IS110 family transposase [Bacteroidia bacterium]|jgi:transposase|nr:IS110 family transposase [Bacteroidia bacterium]
MKQAKELNFEGQAIYCGIDVHKKSWSVCIRDDKMELNTFSQPADTEVLINYLQQNFPRADYHVVYEAGFSGFGLQRILSGQGMDCIITHPADVPTSDKEQRKKTDKVDCRKLARNLSEGSLEKIYIPSERMVDERGIVRARQQLIRDQTRCKNRILSWLDFHGISIPEGYKQSSRFSKRFITWLEELTLTPEARKSLQLLVEGVKFIRQQLLQALRHLKELSRAEHNEKQVSLLRSIPGIGLINAMVILTEMGDIRRFKNLDHLCSYIGLTPDIYSTGETRIVKGITPRHNHSLREALVESSWCIIRKDAALLMAYKKYVKRMHPNKAIIKVAKSLASRIRFVLLNQVEYVTNRLE